MWIITQSYCLIQKHWSKMIKTSRLDFTVITEASAGGATHWIKHLENHCEVIDARGIVLHTKCSFACPTLQFKYLHRLGGALFLQPRVHQGEDWTTTFGTMTNLWAVKLAPRPAGIRFHCGMCWKRSVIVLHHPERPLISLETRRGTNTRRTQRPWTKLSKHRSVICRWVNGYKVDIPVFYKRREESAREPDGITDRQHPQDRELVQHLTDKTKSHVKVRREQPCKEERTREWCRIIHVFRIL